MLFESYTGIIDNADAMTIKQKNSFLKGYRAVHLPIGFVLKRFVSTKNAPRFRDYWVDSQTMTSIMQIFHTNNNFSEAYKKEIIRNSLGIISEWSHLEWRVKITLSKKVIAYFGEIGPQLIWTEQENTFPFGGPKTILKLSEKRFGQYMQFVIPRFEYMPDINEWASVEPVVHI